jgi:hypothetical protein
MGWRSDEATTRRPLLTALLLRYVRPHILIRPANATGLSEEAGLGLLFSLRTGEMADTKGESQLAYLSLSCCYGDREP